MPGFFRRRSNNEFNGDDSDPLTNVMLPSIYETQEEREARIAIQLEEKKRSDAIDEEINRQRLENKKAPRCVRVLLLGQSESGKSTTLKNFQLIHSAKAFRNERASWRAVIQLNIVRSVRLILDTITDAHERSSSLYEGRNGQSTTNPSTPRVTPELLKLRMRLLPLQQVEEALLRKMTPAGSAEFEATHLSPATNLPYRIRGGKFKEIAINSTAQWKGAFGRFLATARASIESAAQIDFDDANDPGVILHACSEDILRLWKDPVVNQLLNMQRIHLESMAGFFLDSIERVTALRYVPTDDDILRARLKTLGVSEHRFMLKAAAWAPYFDNMDAIIFLAPISGFDEVLSEDTNVNRLEDSFKLWEKIISNPLLKETQIVLFLNKIDLLKEKLQAGVQFNEWVLSYRDKPNDYDSIAQYLKKKFGLLLKQHTPIPRVYYCHLTSMTDAKSTQQILVNVKDLVIRQNLQSSNLV
ncbi:guanine nucleotide-binding protein alpha-4 subunit [Panaeolus papilionaceus]|nr:guanine nucleotide-binding protein alpha-4 subunit [Panaeolus papilionaceus]